MFHRNLTRVICRVFVVVVMFYGFIATMLFDSTAKGQPAATQSTQSTQATSAVSFKPTSFPARQFNSQMSLAVYVNDGGEDILVGHTPSKRSLEIPACRMWYVCPVANLEGQENEMELANEINSQNVPGLKIGWMPSPEFLRKLEGVQWLALESFRKNTIANLTGLKQLRSLRLAGKLSEGVSVSLCHLKQLQSLDLEVKISSYDMTMLGDMTQLQELSFGVNEAFDSQSLASLEKLRSLQTLCVDYPEMGDADIQYLRGLTELRVLSLSGSKVTGSNFDTLKKLVNLEELYMDGSYLSDQGMALIELFPKLRVLDASRVVKATDTGVAHLTGLCRLEKLDLTGTAIDGAGLETLKFKTLRELGLSKTKITDSNLKCLLGFPALSKLDLSETAIDGSGFEGRKFDNLRELNLSKTRLTDSGLKFIIGFAHLQRLDVSDTEITGSGFESSQFENLRTLNLSETTLNDAGFGYINSLKKLEYLDLSGTKITNAGMSHFKECINLQYLDLTQVKITDHGLEPLTNCRNLKELWLGKNPEGLTYEGVEGIKRIIPDLQALVRNHSNPVFMGKYSTIPSSSTKPASTNNDPDAGGSNSTQDEN